MSDQIWVAIIGFLGVVITALITALVGQNRTSKSISAKDEDIISKQREQLLAKDTTLHLLKNFKSENELRRKVNRLLKDTVIDRVLGFSAINGMYKPERTSMIFSSIDWDFEDLLGEYEFYAIDSHYQDSLYKAEKDGFCHIVVDELSPDCVTYEFYTAEGVTESLWYIVNRTELASGRVMVFYFSFSTHSDKPINTPEIHNLCKDIINHLQKLITEKQGALLIS